MNVLGVLVILSKGMQTVKLCCNNILISFTS